ncbi:PaaI family thioesterase [Sphingomonas sp.]|uniref:PaaI family thioesterase n=1 Tax=Sphingomonas sp. TaxID=28214 RepID=UPI0035C7DEF0
MKLPPYAAVLGAVLEQAEDGSPVMVMPFHDGVVGRPGFLQGGAISGLLEVAAIAALHHALAEEGGARVKPINVTIDFMRGGRDRETRAAGTITRLGTRVANVEAFAWQDDRARPIAAARMNYLIERD